jgi:hypothetical protein
MTSCHVVYQPIVNPSGKRVVGVETLARWIHPVQGETYSLAYCDCCNRLNGLVFRRAVVSNRCPIKRPLVSVRGGRKIKRMGGHDWPMSGRLSEFAPASRFAYG